MARKLLEGWQFSGVYSYQSGSPIGNFPKAIFNGSFDNLALDTPTPEQWFNVDAGFNRVSAEQLTSFDLRTFPLRVSEPGAIRSTTWISRCSRRRRSSTARRSSCGSRR